MTVRRMPAESGWNATRDASAQRDRGAGADVRQQLERALQDLLEATRRRHGYSPREFVARMRAEAALHAAPGDAPPPPGAEVPGSG